MSSLKKITTQYNESEDRFSITALASNDSVISLWFTQRILVRLIPRMLEWLASGQSSKPKSNKKPDELINDLSHQAARTAFSTEEPVQTDLKPEICGQRERIILINEIDIKCSLQLMQLCFKDWVKIVATLELSEFYARQWLIILHSQWLRSEWQTQLWPEEFILAPTDSDLELH